MMEARPRPKSGYWEFVSAKPTLAYRGFTGAPDEEIPFHIEAIRQRERVVEVHFRIAVSENEAEMVGRRMQEQAEHSVGELFHDGKFKAFFDIMRESSYVAEEEGRRRMQLQREIDNYCELARYRWWDNEQAARREECRRMMRRMREGD